MIKVGRRVAALICALAMLGFGPLPYHHVYAQSVACTATVTPNTMGPGSSATFNIDISNTGSNDIQWIDFTVPSDKFTYAGNSITWSTADHGDGTTATGNTLGAGGNETFQVSATAGVRLTGYENWNVRVSDDPGGNDPQQCGGSLGTAIAGHMPQDVPVGVSDVTVSGITSSSATVNWTSDSPTSSIVYYGTTSEYGATSAYDGSHVTSHSVSLTGLNSNTTYHFQVVGDDGAGSIAYSIDNTLVTAQAPQSGGGQGNTPGSTVNGAGDDKEAPQLSVATKLAATYQAPPTISGSASDNKGVVKVEYSTDGGKNWLPVDNIQTAGAQRVTFSFKPLTQADGNYSVMVRASDQAGNSTTSEAQTMVIDRLPPIVGGSLISLGSQIMQPDEKGVVRALMGTDQQISLSAVGGPTSIVIEAKNTSSKGAQSFSLAKSPDTGLWFGTLAFQRPGVYAMTVKALDGAGNKTERLLNTMVVDQPAQIVDKASRKPVEATVSVYYRDPDTKTWTLWDGAAYGQLNPIKTKAGAYGAYLPAGTYYLKAQAQGYEALITKSVTLDRPGIVSSDIQLKRAVGFRIGKLDVRFPSIVFGQATVSTPKVQSVEASTSQLKTVPDFSLQQSDGGTLKTTNLYGKPTVLTFIATWAPPARDQMAILATVPKQDINIVAVSSGEGRAKLASYTKIGGYELPIAVDANNRVIAQFGASNLPTHYFIDRHGDVKKVVVGVLSKEELLKYVSSGL